MTASILFGWDNKFPLFVKQAIRVLILNADESKYNFTNIIVIGRLVGLVQFVALVYLQA